MDLDDLLIDRTTWTRDGTISLLLRGEGGSTTKGEELGRSKSLVEIGNSSLDSRVIGKDGELEGEERGSSEESLKGKMSLKNVSSLFKKISFVARSYNL